MQAAFIQATHTHTTRRQKQSHTCVFIMLNYDDNNSTHKHTQQYTTHTTQTTVHNTHNSHFGLRRRERGERREERGERRERRSSKKNDDTCKMKSMARGRNICCYTGTPHNGLHQRPPLHRRHPLRCAPPPKASSPATASGVGRPREVLWASLELLGASLELITWDLT